MRHTVGMLNSCRAVGWNLLIIFYLFKYILHQLAGSYPCTRHLFSSCSDFIVTSYYPVVLIVQTHIFKAIFALLLTLLLCSTY